MNVNDLNQSEKAQYKEVASELRCLVCQNQSLADSHASLAVDLKEKIAEQIRAGKTSEEIKSYMQDRYGEFVIYKPAYSLENAALWLGPFVVLVIAIFMARKVVRSSKVMPTQEAQSKNADKAWAEELYKRSSKTR
jgi:cytochrome c-type biogenesis protein CcmH